MAEYFMEFSPERCVACHACETACKSWRELPAGVRFRRVERQWREADAGVTLEHVVVGCMHCTNAPCLERCPAQALSREPATGRIVVDGEQCTGCRACLTACPYAVPQFSGKKSVMAKCDLCLELLEEGLATSPCVATCPTGALCLRQGSAEEKRAEQDAMLRRLSS